VRNYSACVCFNKKNRSYRQKTAG